MPRDSTASLDPPAPANAGGSSADPSAAAPLALGGLGAVLASLCCVGPLVLVLAGIGGAWASMLQWFEPYRPITLAAAGLALALAWRRLYRPASACAPGEVCAVPMVRRGQRITFWIVALLVLAAAAFPYVVPFFFD